MTLQKYISRNLDSILYKFSFNYFKNEQFSIKFLETCDKIEEELKTEAVQLQTFRNKRYRVEMNNSTILNTFKFAKF